MTTLISNNRVRQAASINSNGDIVLGAVSPGCVGFPGGWPAANSETHYILESGGGAWEIGRVYADANQFQTRYVAAGSENEFGVVGFLPDTTGLFIYQGVTQSQVWQACKTSESATAAGGVIDDDGGHNIAVGNEARVISGSHNTAIGNFAVVAEGERGTAVGSEAKTSFPGEVAVGNPALGATRVFPIFGENLNGNPTVYVGRATGGSVDFVNFAGRNQCTPGLMRVTGTVRTRKTSDQSIDFFQVHTVDYSLAVGYDPMLAQDSVTLFGTPVFTLLGAGGTPVVCTLDVTPSGELTVTSPGGDYFSIRGLLQVTCLPN